MLAPRNEIGAITAFNLDPSANRASTIGESSSILLPSGKTIRSIIPRTALSELNSAVERVNTPARST